MPVVVILAGPNGSGKTTSSATLLRGPLRVDAFVNADIIAQGLAGRVTAETAVAAGRIMLHRLDELGDAGANFAFETTLASRNVAQRVNRLKDRGYVVCLLYLWLPMADVAIDRVRDRVRRGGHGVRDDVIRRRYASGLRHFFSLYRPLADVWRCYDNTEPTGPRLVASGVRDVATVHDDATWRRIVKGVQDESE